ncbi:MAG: T9SS type A sorting domain-containing protein, partial [Bacteroidetes bacterium]|nr:T9SS type A sorting domain-containing protein [Bacteroidota bacterium]
SITQNGKYKLSVTNSCGTQKKANYQITLVSGCVWPGDADANGEVNLVDYLVMGLIHGQTGIARANPSVTFTPQTSSPWPGSFANTHPLASGVNYQHVDANGDGVIDAHTDGWVVKRNFQRGYSGMKNDSSLLTLSINFEQSTVNWLDTAYFSINLESSDNSLISNLYGVALTLSYDLPISQPIQILPDSSWLNDGVAFDTLTWQNQRKRELHVGMTRLDQNGVDGSGLLFRGGISVIIDDIGMVSALSESEFLNLKITDAFLIKADGTPIQVSGLSSQSGASIFIRPDQTPEKLESSPQGIWRIGPNPASDYLRIFPPLERLEDKTSVNIKLMNSLGQTVQVFEWRADHSDKMNLPVLPDGTYWLKIEESRNPAILPILIRNN